MKMSKRRRANGALLLAKDMPDEYGDELKSKTNK